jgi:hypothetical protein
MACSRYEIRNCLLGALAATSILGLLTRSGLVRNVLGVMAIATQQVDYLIEPRPALLHRLDLRMDPELRRRMFDPVLMNSVHDGLNPIRAGQLKLLFLAAMHGPPRSDVSIDFRRVVGTDWLSPLLFDRWWLLRTFTNFLHLSRNHAAFRRLINNVLTGDNKIVEKWLPRVQTSNTAIDVYDGLETDTIVYLVEPRPALAPRLENRVNRNLKTYLMEPILVGNEELESSGWMLSDHALLAKLQFLAGIHDFDATFETNDFANVFGSAQLSAPLFDRWFTLTRLETYVEPEACEPILRDLRVSVEATGNAELDAWVGAL